MYRLLTKDGSVSHKLFTLADAKKELNSSIIAVVTPRSHKIVAKSQAV